MIPSRRPYEILIAEDNSGDVLLVREALDRQEIPYNLQMASDGSEAISLIERRDREPLPLLDLVIVDIQLPKYDGLAVVEWLRNTAHLRATPVIVLSGFSADRIQNQTTKYDFVHAFSKPADFNGFMQLGRLADTILRPEMRATGEEPASKADGRTV